MAPQKFSDWCVDSSGYHPTTHGGQEKLRLQIENEIKCQIFSDRKWVSEMRDLADASDRLEESMERMLRIGSNVVEPDKQLEIWNGNEEDDNPIQNSVDSRFDHSWIPNGPGLGWVWIPKGRLCLDITYPANREDVRRHGYLARTIHATQPPRELTKTFAAVVKPRAMAHPNRPMGKRRQEEWMEEDDLL